MAVQKSKVTPSRRGMRRSHDALTNTNVIAEDEGSGELRRRHHVGADGFYKGKKVIEGLDND